MALQTYCQEKSQQPSAVIAYLAFEDLVHLCEEQIDVHEIQDGVIGGRPRPEPPPSKTKPPRPPRPNRTERRRVPPNSKGSRPIHRFKAPLSAEMMALHDHFAQMMKDLFPEREFASGARVLVRPNVFYQVDRRKGSHAIVWRCTVRKGRDPAIACVRFKPRLKRLDIQLPVTVEDLEAALAPSLIKKLRPTTLVSGQFKTLCKGLDKEGIGLCAQTIRTLVDQGLISLEAVR